MQEPGSEAQAPQAGVANPPKRYCRDCSTFQVFSGLTGHEVFDDHLNQGREPCLGVGQPAPRPALRGGGR
jgi:hypothetical protein